MMVSAAIAVRAAGGLFAVEALVCGQCDSAASFSSAVRRCRSVAMCGILWRWLGSL